MFKNSNNTNDIASINKVTKKGCQERTILAKATTYTAWIVAFEAPAYVSASWTRPNTATRALWAAWGPKHTA